MAEPTRQELIETIQNLMGAFDTPLGRLKISGDFPDEARKLAREVLSRLSKEDLPPPQDELRWIREADGFRHDR